MGAVPSYYCNADHPEQRGAMCYETCPEGFQRRNDDLEFCTSLCPPGFKDIGMGGCERPRRNVKSQVMHYVNLDWDAYWTENHAPKRYMPP